MTVFSSHFFKLKGRGGGGTTTPTKWGLSLILKSSHLKSNCLRNVYLVQGAQEDVILSNKQN